MNTDQVTSLVRSGLKLAAGALIAHGYSATGNFVTTETVVGFVVGLIGLAWSHFFHKSDAPAA